MDKMYKFSCSGGQSKYRLSSSSEHLQAVFRLASCISAQVFGLDTFICVLYLSMLCPAAL